MKNIGIIFRRDIKGLLKNFLALVIAVGICVLPALYAWFNIYANWDPYSNTGNVKIAVVNNDEGWVNDDNENLNMGDSVVDALKEKDSIGWVFLDSEDDATEGVKSGEYYAAIVIDSDFTYGMYHGVKENVESPKITYYVNDKKNAVAVKITDTAVSSVQRSVNQQFVKAVVEGIFENTNIISADLQDDDIVGSFIEKLEAVDESLVNYNQMITDLMDGNKDLSGAAGSLSEAMTSGQNAILSGMKELESGKNRLSSTQASFNSFSTDINAQLTNIETTLTTLSQQISDAQLQSDVNILKENLKQIGEKAGELANELANLYQPIQGAGNSNLQNTIDTMKNIATGIETAAGTVDLSGAAEAAVSSAQTALNTYAQNVSDIKNLYNNQVVPQVTGLIDRMKEVLTSVETMLGNVSDTTGTMGDVFVGVSDTLDVLNMSLADLQEVLTSARVKVEDAINSIKEADANEQLDVIMNLLSGNPESLGEFFAEPVKVSDNYVYEIANYGSGVAPFYTTLAIWVGMTILVSIVKVHADRSGLVNVKPSELYFGRYFTFLLLSQIQTAIIVWGDLVLLKIQCLHPWKFYGAAAFASLVFSLLIYSLTIAFGDIGKAFAVVVMVIQIAGSGGTYPIEALPSYFRGMYIFFPFPYVINAMRECIGGMYENTYLVCMLELAIFGVAALVIGLVIRIPFMKLNEFIEERMEDTEML